MSYRGRHAGDAGAPSDPNSDLFAAAQEWLDEDPDPDTRAELGVVLEDAAAGDQEALGDLADRFAGRLEFGTAGLRGALGAGPNRMNRAVVIRAAAGLTAYLQEIVGGDLTEPGVPTVVIGYDARHNSDVFARDTAAVVEAAGGRALLLPSALPTPVLAYAIRRTGADAGVMVTASHNPPQDNGYKVYLGDGSQIVSPTDAQIAERIDRIRSLREVQMATGGWQTLGEDVLADYVANIARLAGDGPRDLKVVATALHGVGAAPLRTVFAAAGFAALVEVAEQSDPDPDFPTVAFPNPEEPGAMDLALALAAEVDADLVIANDPDADRCAVAVPGRDGTWCPLRGDELGAILGSHLIMRGVPTGGVFANSIVSSRLLAAVAAGSGVEHAESLTGFKWISRVPGLSYGYEEALGYCVAPELVADKDGLSAALLVAELAAILKAEGRGLLDVLDDLETQYGVHAADSFSVRVEDLTLIGEVMQRLRAEPPSRIADRAVTNYDDLAEGVDGLPPTEGLRWLLEDGSRVIVRPSGTEPKLKIYLEAIAQVAGEVPLQVARDEALLTLGALREDLTRLTAV